MNEQETNEATETEEIVEEKQSITEVKPMVLLVAELGNVSEDLIKGNFSALVNLMDEFFAIPNIDWKLFVLQIKDVDAAERMELVNLLKNKFDLDNDQLEILIEAIIDSAEKTYFAVESWVNVGKRIKNFNK